VCVQIDYSECASSELTTIECLTTEMLSPQSNVCVLTEPEPLSASPCLAIPLAPEHKSLEGVSLYPKSRESYNDIYALLCSSSQLADRDTEVAHQSHTGCSFCSEEGSCLFCTECPEELELEHSQHMHVGSKSFIYVEAGEPAAMHESTQYDKSALTKLPISDRDDYDDRVISKQEQACPVCTDNSCLGCSGTSMFCAACSSENNSVPKNQNAEQWDAEQWDAEQWEPVHANTCTSEGCLNAWFGGPPCTEDPGDTSIQAECDIFMVHKQAHKQFDVAPADQVKHLDVGVLEAEERDALYKQLSTDLDELYSAYEGLLDHLRVSEVTTQTELLTRKCFFIQHNLVEQFALLGLDNCERCARHVASMLAQFPPIRKLVKQYPLLRHLSSMEASQHMELIWGAPLMLSQCITSYQIYMAKQALPLPKCEI